MYFNITGRLNSKDDGYQKCHRQNQVLSAPFFKSFITINSINLQQTKTVMKLRYFIVYLYFWGKKSHYKILLGSDMVRILILNLRQLIDLKTYRVKHIIHAALTCNT